MKGPRTVDTSTGKLDVAKVLDLVNAARVERGDPPLEDLPEENEPEQSESCVIAQALNIEVSAEVDYDYVTFGNEVAAEAAWRAWKRTKKNSQGELHDEYQAHLPVVLARFAKAFDHGALVRTHPHLYSTSWLLDEMENALQNRESEDAEQFIKALEGRGVDDEIETFRKLYE